MCFVDVCQKSAFILLSWVGWFHILDIREQSTVVNVYVCLVEVFGVAALSDSDKPQAGIRKCWESVALC